MYPTMTDRGLQYWSDRLGGEQSVDRSYLCLTASTASNRMLKLENKAVVSFKLKQKNCKVEEKMLSYQHI